MSRRLVIPIVFAVIAAFGGAPVPVVAIAVPTITTIAAGGMQFSCAVTGTGGVKCWGENQTGQLGDGSTTSRMAPVDVVGLGSGVVSIAAGSSHACALTNRGGVKCWGNNYSGQLGDGTGVSATKPVEVSGLGAGVAAVATGYYSTCALTLDGAILCWGLDVAGGARPLAPIPVAGLVGDFVAVAVGSLHACALTAAGKVLCWGGNEHGQLGPEAVGRFSGVVPVTGLPPVRAIAAGDRHSCALTDAGAVLCWGSNRYGQLGVAPFPHTAVPVMVNGLPDGVSKLAAGYRHTCSLTQGGGLRCWGQNGFGQLGNGTSSTTFTPPTDVTGLTSGVSAVSAAERHTCAVADDGRGLCWGTNAHGQLGNQTGTNSKAPVQVDLATHLTIELGASRPVGPLPAGAAVTFTASVRPSGPGHPPIVVRFEVYRRVDGVWRRHATRNLSTDAAGRATLRWTFATVGLRYVRAMALENAAYAASRWSPRIDYAVR